MEEQKIKKLHSVEDVRILLTILRTAEEEMTKADDIANQEIAQLQSVKHAFAAKKYYDNLYNQLREALPAFMEKNDVKTIETIEGIKATLCVRHSYEVENYDKLPDEYQLLRHEKEIKSLYKEIKQKFELLNKKVPGIKQKITKYATITLPKSKAELGIESET